MAKNRWLIIHPEGNSFNNPTVKSLIDICLENGVILDIIGQKVPGCHYPCAPGLRWLFHRNGFLERFKALSIRRLCSKILSQIAFYFEKLDRYDYDLIIGVDREGIIQARFFAEKLRIPLVFFSFEIMFLSETTFRYKALERNACRCADIWIVQDEQRLECLVRENLMDREKAFICPVGSFSLPGPEKFRIRDKLGIPASKKVAAVIGSMNDWSMTREILESTVDWPDEWVLLLNHRYGKVDEIYTRKSECFIDQKRVYVNANPVDSLDDMNNLLAGVDVGLAFYRPIFDNAWTGKNLQYLGRASGKIATYVRHGVPVIMTKQGLYHIDNEVKRFGFAVDSPKEISFLLKHTNFTRLRVNAEKYFLEKLDSAIYLPNLFERLVQLSCPTYYRQRKGCLLPA